LDDQGFYANQARVALLRAFFRALTPVKGRIQARQVERIAAAWVTLFPNRSETWIRNRRNRLDQKLDAKGGLGEEAFVAFFSAEVPEGAGLPFKKDEFDAAISSFQASQAGVEEEEEEDGEGEEGEEMAPSGKRAATEAFRRAREEKRAALAGKPVTPRARGSLTPRTPRGEAGILTQESSVTEGSGMAYYFLTAAAVAAGGLMVMQRYPGIKESIKKKLGL